MKTTITLILLTLIANHLNAQNWSGVTPGNIYYNQGNVTIGGSTSTSANLHIGKRESTTNGGEVQRLSIQPYYHTGGPWIFKSRDTQNDAFLDIVYGPITSMTLKSFGDIGVGTTDPKFRVHIRSGNTNSELMSLGSTATGSFALTSSDGGAYGLFAGVGGTGNAWLQVGRYDENLAYNLVLQASGGNVLIGKANQANTGYKLDVNGSIRSNEIVVNTDGADFVFNSDYKLRTIEEVEAYIKVNKHLPEIKSAEEMQANGLEVGEMEIKLLQKIEELTLYMIDFKKEMGKIVEENQKLKERVTELEKN